MSMPVVLNQLQSIDHLLTPVEKRIAVLIKENPLDFSTLPGKTLAVQAKVSESALIRFSQRMGFSGLREMKLVLMRDLHMLKRESLLTQNTASPKSLLHQTFGRLHEALNRTECLLDQTQVEGAAEIIARARGVLIICPEQVFDFKLRLAEAGISCDVVQTYERYLKLADYYDVTFIVGELSAGQVLPIGHTVILLGHQTSARAHFNLQISYEDELIRPIVQHAVMDILYMKLCQSPSADS